MPLTLVLERTELTSKGNNTGERRNLGTETCIMASTVTVSSTCCFRLLGSMGRHVSSFGDKSMKLSLTQLPKPGVKNSPSGLKTWSWLIPHASYEQLLKENFSRAFIKWKCYSNQNFWRPNKQSLIRITLTIQEVPELCTLPRSNSRASLTPLLLSKDVAVEVSATRGMTTDEYTDFV